MDSCQLIRKETKMDVVHLNQKQLATRWCISEATLERWRNARIGPKFLKLCGRVLYRQAEIEAYEESCLATSTKTVAAPAERCSVSSANIYKYRRFATRRHSGWPGRCKFPAQRKSAVRKRGPIGRFC